MGIGSLLMKSLVDLFESNGIWILQGVSFPENNASAALLYNYDFRIVGIKKIGWLNGRWRDVLLTERGVRKPGSVRTIKPCFFCLI
ncbi:MAG TPA: hypothetical protein VK436_15580 [Methanocella sp.]|nr:hypothetical protein [Methanocella sp.]